MIDFLGNKIAISDSVIIIAPDYRKFATARVIGLTNKNVRVAYVNVWNYSEPGHLIEILQRSEQLIRVGGPEMTEHIAKMYIKQ